MENEELVLRDDKDSHQPVYTVVLAEYILIVSQ
jgi:hypothetical protein